MVEFAMIFGLGFLTAALLALLAGPLLSRRAERRARAALERRLPVSRQEIAAARDQAAADHAVALRAAELRAEATGERLAVAMADAGRQLARAVEADTRFAEASAKAETLASALAAAEQAAEAARQDLASRTSELGQSSALAEERAAALATANERVASVETMISGQRQLLEELGRRLADHGESLDGTTAATDAKPSADQEPSPPPPAPPAEPSGAAEVRLRSEAAALRRAEALAVAERDRLRLKVDELLLRVAELEEEGGEFAERAEADRREGLRQAKLVANLTKRLATRDEAIKGLRRQLTAATGARPPVPTTNAGFREAIASLAAELVSFAEKEARERSGDAPTTR